MRRLALLAHLVPPHPCDAPEQSLLLEQSLQARVVAVMWIHAIGAAVQGGVGGGAYANGLTRSTRE